MAEIEIDEEGLEFFSGLSGHLNVELSHPPQPVAEGLLNLRAPPEARVERVTLELQVYENDELRELSEDEWNRVVLEAPSIQLRGEDGDLALAHAAPDGRRFTVRDLARAIAETERIARGSSEWLGGIDVHHVYFEGIELDEDGVWNICWGS